MTIETVLEFDGLFDRPYDISKSNIFQSWTPKADLKENVIFEKKKIENEFFECFRILSNCINE